MVLACKRFTKKVFNTVRVRNQRRLTKYWIEKASRARKEGW